MKKIKESILFLFILSVGLLFSMPLTQTAKANSIPTRPQQNILPSPFQVTFHITNQTVPVQNILVFISNLADYTDAYGNTTDQYGNATFLLSVGEYSYQIYNQQLKIFKGTLNVTDSNLYMPIDISGITTKKSLKDWAIANATLVIMGLLAAALVLAYIERKRAT